jgi:hypothetical protein
MRVRTLPVGLRGEAPHAVLERVEYRLPHLPDVRRRAVEWLVWSARKVARTLNGFGMIESGERFVHGWVSTQGRTNPEKLDDS